MKTKTSLWKKRLHRGETHGWDEAHAERKSETCDKFEFMRNEYAVLVKIVLCLEKRTINMYMM